MNKNQIDNFSSLILFLDKSEKLISHILENRYEFILKDFATDESFWSTLEYAWKEVKENFKQVRQVLETSPSEFTYKLKEHGLTDDQLNFKMELYYRLIDYFYATRALIWLRRLLNLVNSILGSLTSIFSPLEPVKEFKEALEQIIKKRKNLANKKPTGSKREGVRYIRI